MSSHELNKRIPTTYPTTPDLSTAQPAPSSPAGQGVLPFAPIRPAADYDSDDEDADEPSPVGSSSTAKPAHKSRPSAAGLLSSSRSGAVDPGARAGPSVGRGGAAEAAEQAKARRIEDYDAPVRPLLDKNLSLAGKVRAFVKLNEGEFPGECM